MDFSTGTRFEDGRQRYGRNGYFVYWKSGRLMLPSDLRVRGREAGIWNLEELGGGALIANSGLNYGLIGTLQTQHFCIAWSGFDVYTAPSLFIECEAYGINYWILSPDINIKALGESTLHLAESAPQHHVLEILCIRHNH